MEYTRFPIERGHILMFARAIGEPDDRYDPEDPEAEVPVPPTFGKAVAQFERDYRLRPKPGQPWFGSGRLPSGVDQLPSGTGLHAEQHFEYHRPVRAGDVLRVEERLGSSWTREGGRGGTLTFQEFITDYRNEHGDLMITATRVSVQTSRPVDGD